MSHIDCCRKLRSPLCSWCRVASWWFCFHPRHCDSHFVPLPRYRFSSSACAVLLGQPTDLENLVQSQGEHAESSSGSTEWGANQSRLAHPFSSSRAGGQRCPQYRRRAHASRPGTHGKGTKGKNWDGPCRRGKTRVAISASSSVSGKAATQIPVSPKNHYSIRRKRFASSASASAASHLEIVAGTCVLIAAFLLDRRQR